MTPQEKADIEESAFYLTVLLSKVNPKINEDETMELLVEMLSKGLDVDVAAQYGELIFSTTMPTSKTTH